MANPHQQHPGFPSYGVNPASLTNPNPANPNPNPSGAVPQNPFYTSAGQPMSNPAMLAALNQQQARYAHMKQQQQQQQVLGINPAALSAGGPTGNPNVNMAFNPTQLQLNPQHAIPNANATLTHQLASMTPHERQIAQAKAMAQHQAQAQAHQSHTPSQYAEQQHQQQHQQQQQYGYDARMMPPPPPPAQQQQQQQQQRPPSTRPSTAGSGAMQRPGTVQVQGAPPYGAQQQYQQQQSQRFSPMHGFDGQPQPQPQGYAQQQQQQQHSQQHPQQQQQFPSHMPGSANMNVNMNMGNMTPAQLQQLHQLHAHAQSQAQSHSQAAQSHTQPHPQPQPQPQPQPHVHAQDPRMAQLQALQAQSQAQAHAQSQLHPPSPSTRKRKLPPVAPVSSTAASGSGALPAGATGGPSASGSSSSLNINPNVQRMSMNPISTADTFAAPRSVAPPNPQALALSLPPAITRITAVPLAGSGTTIPPLTPAEIKDMEKWMKRDKEYEPTYAAMRERASREVADALRVKLGWWEDGEGVKGRKGERERFGVLWPEQKRAARVRKMKKAGVRWEGVRLPSNVDKEMAERREDLVPIRLEVDVEHQKFRETFVWNVNDPLVTPEIFAQSVVDDFKLASHHANAIAKAIQEQLHEHDSHSPEDGEGDARSHTISVDRRTQSPSHDGRERGALDAAGEAWWTCWRKRIRTEDGYVRVGGEDRDGDADDEGIGKKSKGKARQKRKGRSFGVMVPEVMGEGPMEVDQIQVENVGVDEELRILIKLDILVGTMKLDDQFEWDVGCTTNSPEQFAALYTTELGLPGEFTTAIAHQIREQVHAYRKTLSLLGAGHPADDDDLRPAFLPPVTRGTVARSVDTASAHMPLLNYMSDGEVERNERERDKELKRKRRHARGRALGARGVLPDRTHRTPGIGFPESDNAALQAAQAASVPTTSRRAAAAAASLTIANMVASENGGLPMQLSVPEPSKPPSSAKDAAKKASRVPPRLFKAPPYPPTALRPRAKIVAPTPSTGLDPAEYGPVVPQEPTEQKPDEPPPPPPPPPVPAKLTAKQLRDLEKEAKEKEYAEGQHENIIDGVWHCSNCGCPETIAVGRRKGPLGDKSQCGPCGKFYHRHRRPRPCEYHADESYHVNLKAEADRAKAVNRRKGGAAALRAMNQEATSAPESSTSVINLKSSAGAEQEEGEEEEDKLESTKDEPEPINVVDIVGPPPESATGAASPADTSSSEEPPLALAKTIPSRVNGSSKPRSAPELPAPASAFTSARTVSPPPPPVAQPRPQPSPQPAPASVPVPIPAASTTSVKPGSSVRSVSKNQAPRPEWLKNALDAMQSRYPDDKFDVVLRKTTEPTAPAEWRVKCLDCPGKLYTPGPAETLANFEVHLKNRFHRAKVNARVQGISPPP